MQTFSRVRRNRGPALAWTPTQDSYYELAQMLWSEGRLPLYFTQAAILELEAHLRESSLPLPFGLLAGDVCICSQTKLEYLLVDTVSRARIELGGDDPYAQLAEELQALASEQTGKNKVAVGWYLGGLADDLTLDDDVTRLHARLFPERWQVALVRGTVSGAERGAVLRYESIWSRWYAIPFFEFLSEHAGHNKGEPRTAIRWENYRADQPSQPLDGSELSARAVSAAPRPSWRARLFGASPEPVRRAERGTPARATEERTRATSTPTQQESPSLPRSRTMTSPAAPPPTVGVPASRSNPLEITPSPRRAPESPPVRPAERKVAAHVDQPVTIPVEQELTAPLKPAGTASVEQQRAAPVEETVTTHADLRVAPTRELKVASTAALKIAAPEEVKPVPAPEVSVAATVGRMVASPAATRVARAEPHSDLHHVFIDGGLVPLPLAYDSPQGASLPAGQNGLSKSSLVVGVLLLVMLVLLYLIVR